MSDTTNTEGDAPAGSDGAGDDVHVHKPKAAHSLREFLSEISVIVVGIMIALAGEQAVEALHWRHVNEQTMKDLDKEVRENLVAAADRLSFRECLKGRLADLRDQLVANNGAWKADPFNARRSDTPGPHEVMLGHVMPIVHGLPYFTYTHEAWDAARASGAVSHLSHEKLAFYASLYDTVERLNVWQASEAAAATRLAPLAYDTTLGRGDRDARLADLAAVDANAFYVDQFSGMMLGQARAQGLRPDKAKVADWIKEGRELAGPCVNDVAI